MSNGIEFEVFTDGHVQVYKDTTLFGGANMWNFYVKNTKGKFIKVQWMDVEKAQLFFNTRLTRYIESPTSSTKYIKIGSSIDG